MVLTEVNRGARESTLLLNMTLRAPFKGAAPGVDFVEVIITAHGGIQLRSERQRNSR